MSIFVRFLILSTILVVSLNAKWFFGNSAFVGSSFSSDSQAGLKMYVQHDALPALTVIGGYTHFSWLQTGVSYLGNTIGANQSLSQETISLGLGATLWAKGNFYIDASASYYFLEGLTFSGGITDASFPTSAYDLQLGFGYNISNFSLRPYYSMINFSEDYIVLSQTMLSLSRQQTFGLELIYWY